MVVAGPTTDVIYVLVPDKTTYTADEIAPADLQHVIGIRLGAPENLGSNLPREDLHLSLCENSLRPTLIADRRVYWAEITPLLQRSVRLHPYSTGWSCSAFPGCVHMTPVVHKSPVKGVPGCGSATPVVHNRDTYGFPGGGYSTPVVKC